MSLWTETPRFRAERGPLLFATLAANLGARAFPETRLVTDNRGAELAALFGWPFQEVTRELSTWNTARLRHAWAAGKLIANAIQDRPFVQFDWDVLLFKPLPAKFTASRLLAQSPDFAEFYRGADSRAWMRAAGYREDAIPFNAGLVGGTDLALIRDYSLSGLALAERFPDGDGTHLSMFAEQYHLAAFTEAAGARVETLLPMRPTRDELAAAGYAHMTGAKYSSRWIARAETRLAADFPEALARFREVWPLVDSRARE